VPILAGLSGTAAIAAYLNAKYHIAHDLSNDRGGLTPTQAAVDYITERTVSKRLLTYHIIQEHARNQPHHPFLIFEGKTWTYKDFYESVVRVANWLMNDLNIEVGELVALDGGNSPEYFMLWFGLDAIGAVTSFINWNLTGAGLEHCVKVSLQCATMGLGNVDGVLACRKQVCHRRFRCAPQRGA
jgi:hypothetical protein